MRPVPVLNAKSQRQESKVIAKRIIAWAAFSVVLQESEMHELSKWKRTWL